tara:strand:- start:59 stop:205 length:147 start_codon:yes stop_codon:yes gene_type:complete
MGISLEDTQKKLDKALKRNLVGQPEIKAIPAPTKPDAPEAESITDNED